MIPFDCMPGAKQWAGGLPQMVAHCGPLWVWGAFGSGVSTLAQCLAEQRGSEVIEYNSTSDFDSWLKSNPLGVVASEHAIELTQNNKCGDFLELRLWSLDDDPSAIQLCLEHLAREEGIRPPFPPVLSRLPCDGNLRELRNRLIRWHSLGQVPEPETAKPVPELLENEDIASNLHILERLLLHRALRRSYGNRADAAKRLSVSRRQLYLLIGRHGDPVRGDIPTADAPKRLTKVIGSRSPVADEQ